MKPFAAVFLLLASACTQPNNYNKFLDTTNRVDILVYNGGDTLFFDTQDSTGIDILRSQVNGNTNDVKDTCTAMGLLRFRQDSTVLLEAPFAVTPGKSGGNCNYITYAHDDDSYVQPLSERAQKLLGRVVQNR